jgi:hypothetical protein
MRPSSSAWIHGIIASDRRGIVTVSMGKTLLVLNRMVADGTLRQYAIWGAVAALTYIEPTVTGALSLIRGW